MCTLSFLPENEGYVAAMNRDELKSRGVATAPAIHRMADMAAVYPREASGGTWIAATSHGNLFALLNWNLGIDGQLPEKLRSRGELIPSLLGEETAERVEVALRKTELRGIHPFRLVGIFPRERDIREWRWNGEKLSRQWQEWTRNHWFSSSRSDERAEATRRKACEMMGQEGGRQGREWLRQLHASHLPEAGAYSICVHRDDASTVSFTEVCCSETEIEMTYTAGNPCAPQGDSTTIRLPNGRVTGAFRKQHAI